MTDETVQPQTLREWLGSWLDTHYPDKTVTIDPKQARQRSLDELPSRLIPLLAFLLKNWWTPRFNSIAKSLGYGFVEHEVRIETDTDEQPVSDSVASRFLGRRVRKQMGMGQLTLWPLEQLALWAIQRYRDTANDDAATRRGIEVWATANPSVNLDVDDAVLEFKRRAAA